MSSGPNLATVAALIGDRARADMLSALMSGKALTASELATVAGITKQTASAHLAKLLDRRLLSLEKQGRHRYFRIANADVAELLENLMKVSERIGATRLRIGPGDLALRRARVCYDHMAGEMGVRLLEGLRKQRLLRIVGDGAELTSTGERVCADLGIRLETLAQSRRPLCRLCLDWSERRHHLAGSLGAALLKTFFAQGWARRRRNSRIVILSAAGLRAVDGHFGVRTERGLQ